MYRIWNYFVTSFKVQSTVRKYIIFTEKLLHEINHNVFCMIILGKREIGNQQNNLFQRIYCCYLLQNAIWHRDIIWKQLSFCGLFPKIIYILFILFGLGAFDLQLNKFYYRIHISFRSFWNGFYNDSNITCLLKIIFQFIGD
jgi:hypothetical protein